MSAPDEAATRRSYDALGTAYARALPDLSTEAPLDRSLLTLFVETVRTSALSGPVLDVGCGTGRLTRHLSAQGLDVLGIDLSPGMVATAATTPPRARYLAGSVRALPVRSASASAVLAWYSLIHLPADELAGALVELARVAAPGAMALIAFQCGQGERVDRPASYGEPIALTYYRHRVDDVVSAALSAGFVLHARVLREAALPFEASPQAALLFHCSP